MNKPDDSKPEEQAPAATDVESQREATAGGEVSNIVHRWRRADILKRGSLAFRAFGFLFSLLDFLIMATNTHGGGREFDRYEEYRYVLAIAILSSLYSGLQTWRQIHEFYTSRETISRQNVAIIGDQIIFSFISSTFDKQYAARIRQHIYGFLSISNQYGILCILFTGFIRSHLWIQTLYSNLHLIT